MSKRDCGSRARHRTIAYGRCSRSRAIDSLDSYTASSREDQRIGPPATLLGQKEYAFTMAHRSADEKVAEELARHGLRATRQRIAALRLLRRLKSHPTSAELHTREPEPEDRLRDSGCFGPGRPGYSRDGGRRALPIRSEAGTPLSRYVSRLQAPVRRSGWCGPPDPEAYGSAGRLPRREDRRHDTRRVPSLSGRDLRQAATFRRRDQRASHAPLKSQH